MRGLRGLGFRVQPCELGLRFRSSHVVFGGGLQAGQIMAKTDSQWSQCWGDPTILALEDMNQNPSAEKHEALNPKP